MCLQVEVVEFFVYSVFIAVLWLGEIVLIATSARIRVEVNFGGHVSVRTVNRRLNG